MIYFTKLEKEFGKEDVKRAVKFYAEYLNFELEESPKDMQELMDSLEVIYGKTEQGLKQAYKEMFGKKAEFILKKIKSLGEQNVRN